MGTEANENVTLTQELQGGVLYTLFWKAPSLNLIELGIHSRILSIIVIWLIMCECVCVCVCVCFNQLFMWSIDCRGKSGEMEETC